MCGRYASSRSREELVVEFEVEFEAGEDHLGEPKRGFNIAPTDTVAVVVERTAVPAPGLPEEEVSASVLDAADAHVTAELINDERARAVRQLRSLKWGLVPSWSKDASGGARMINARLETLLEKPAYKKAALSRRCLVPADGWYEWQVSPTAKDARGRPRKQPFFMSPADGGGLALAGVYEFWRDARLPTGDPAAWLITFAVITTAAEPGLDTVHDRMPLVLPRDRWAHWLDPALNDPASVRGLTENLPAGRFTALPISTRVNSVRNDGPELIEPAPADSLAGVVDPATGELLGGPPAGSLF
ncbi:SOS response-associated peptidase [Kineosporia sp. J2-2]|uniref:Abasic site processing protein n=1 Tax=Kineosporia corallincola TaxID=2835133 RepID=A0ABS5TCC7_9ACTN|nr:SOS response-associated peptidase [Kineosporia corallincola]MBT0768074.1 SOS response-associated peptidase [Kineosporia corallincola]